MSPEDTWIERVWSWVPAFDGQTIFSIAIGLVATFFTFWWAYRQTIGAREERIRLANRDLIVSVLHRVAVEREVLKSEQFGALRQAKVFRADIPRNRLLSFSEVLDAVLADVLDNRFLDKPAKNMVIGLIEECRKTGVTESSADDRSLEERRKWQLLALLGAMSAIVGYVSAGAATFASRAITQSEGQLILTSVVIVATLSIIISALREFLKAKSPSGRADISDMPDELHKSRND